MKGDILKVFHFIGARRKRYYMYKQALEAHTLGKAKPEPFLKISHLDMDGSYYSQFMNGRVLEDYEIVQSMVDDFEDRPRIRVETKEQAS